VLARWVDPLGRDDKVGYLVVGDDEVPIEVGGSAWEVAGEAAADQVPICAELLGAGDLGRVGVFGCGADLPGVDLGRTMACLAFVDDRGVVCEEADDGVDVPICVEFEVARDDLGDRNGHASSLQSKGQRSAALVLPGRRSGMAAQQ